MSDMTRRVKCLLMSILILLTILTLAFDSQIVKTDPETWTHDVALVSIAVSFPYGASAVFPGWGHYPEEWKQVRVDVVVENHGTEFENFTVTAYYDNHAIHDYYGNDNQTVTNLPPGVNLTLTFYWDTMDVDPCTYNYTLPGYIPYNISAEASVVPGEVDTADNIMVDGTLTVRKPGDANGDDYCGIGDLSLLGGSWDQSYPSSYYKWRADFNGDGRVYIGDLAILGRNWYRNASLPEKGDRILSIDVNTAEDNDYNNAFYIAKSAGMQATTLSFCWDDIEIAPMVYDNDFLAIANWYYPPRNTNISLAINPIDTNHKRVPSDLTNVRFDDPIMIERFNMMLDYVFSQIPNLQLTSLSIGNEIDIYLGTDAAKWEQYKAFYSATKAYAKTLRPGLIVGTKATFYGLTGYAQGYLEDINQISDIVMVTYYPLNGDFTVRDPTVVESDFEALTSIYNDKPIFILECGYPSSGILGSSESKQREFVEEVFKAWDIHNSQIRLISFTWLHDVSQATVDQWAIYYGISDINFLEYLRTLGLRTYDGRDKEAFVALKTEAKARGW